MSRLFCLVALLALPALAAAPTVATNSATSVTATTAVFNGTANPGGEATTGWFRSSTVNPGTCDDTFGTRVPASGGTAVGMGTANVAYSVSTTGLLPGTTYFVCAIVQNASGLAFGNVLSFTTPALAPTVFTGASTLVTSNSATLNATATPNGAATIGYFRYSTTNPGSCFDSFGTRVPVTVGTGTALGNGNASVPYAAPITGLLPGTTYFFCAFASNNLGVGAGVVLTFTTLVAAPTVTTTAANFLNDVSANLTGLINPNGDATTGYFRVSTSNPGTCNDAFGTRVPAVGGSNVGSGTAATSYSQGASGLTPGTQYFFCAIAQNSVGTSFGAVLTFTTLAVPTVTTDPETFVTTTTATLNGTATPNLSSTTGYFRYSTTNPGICDDVFGARAPTAGGTALGAGTTPQGFTQLVSLLLPGTTYYFCAIAQNGVGRSFGGIRSFTTPPAIPIVSTLTTSLVTGTSATFNGQATPRGAPTTGYFRYATVSPGLCNDTFGTRAPGAGGSALGSSNTTQPFSEAVTGLTRGTTYFVCALGQNSAGLGMGLVQSFTTPNLPTVTTSGATGLGGTSATLNGTANPNGAAATGYFRYSTVSPGTCDDTFGTRAPVSGGTSITFSQAYSQLVTGLTPATTYFYCAISTNAEGTGFGTLATFTTPAAPTVVTNPPTSLTATSTVLNGSVTPNGAATTAWFRYATVDPGACDNTFGTSTTTFAMGSGSTASPLAVSLTLTPGQQYWYCAVAQNGVGFSFGAVQTFTAPATAPIVTTGGSASVTGTTVTLNGSAVPRGASSTGYFRYATTSPGTCNDTFGTRFPSVGGTALGAGNSSQLFTSNVTGLTPGTTYFWCALGSNVVGVGVGAVASFTTANIPTVVTNPPSSVTGSSAIFSGSANPNLGTSLAYFRYDTTDPGTCNDTFGTRFPATGGTALSGSTAQGFTQTPTTLTPGTTYYVCALASNVVGIGVGVVRSFTTPAAPSVTTLPATAVGATTGTLNASGIPNNSPAQGWFRYSSVDPVTCNDSFGTRAPSVNGTALGSATASAPFSVTPTGLLPGTTYYFCALASNGVGTSFGAVLSFTTPALAPLVTTVSTTNRTDTTVTLNGSATPQGDVTTGWFRYSTVSPGVCNDVFGTRAPVVGVNVGSGNTAQAFSTGLTGLTPNTTYFWCALGSNGVGLTAGTLASFTTAALPTVTTQAASPVTQTTATLNATANPNGSATTAWFRYSATDPGTCSDAFGTRMPAAGGTLFNGSTAQAYNQPISGLLPGNQYFFCGIAQNVIGPTLGGLLSFTTPPNAPTVTTGTPVLTATTGTLNGTVNPNGAPTTAWFRYSTSNPGVCNDAFGTRAPASGGTMVPFGNSAVAYSEPIMGLTAGTTYYVCAIAQNSVGLSFGTVLTVITPSIPTTTTVVATGVTSTGATLGGTGNPNRATATGYFRYSTTNPGTCNDTFGTRTPAMGDAMLGSGSAAVSFTQAITGLTNGTTYFYCAITQNVVGLGFGNVISFTTLNAPTVTTGATTLVTGTTATLNGTANPNGATATGWFRYSTVDPVTCNDTFGTRAPTVGIALGAGTTAAPYSTPLTGLTAGTTYYVCAIASNTAGVSFGNVSTFTTPGAPTVVTAPVTAIAATTATLNGTANPNLGATTGYFRYSTTFLTVCNDTFGTRVPLTGGTMLGAGSMAAPFTENLTGLTPATTYYVCAIGSNVTGTRFGAVQTFTTLSAPAVTSNAATSVTSTTASLNGSVNPRGDATTAWFRYSTTNPGACNNTFGTQAPVVGASIGAGTTAVATTQALMGLTPGTTYFFCAVAQNSQGLGFGTVLSFTTLAAPAVTTVAASSVLGSTAVLNGTANPNGAATTGYFRYATTNPGTCDDTFGTRWPTTGGSMVGSGFTAATYAQALTGLTSSTTYFYCAIGVNSEGTSFGSVLQFTTLAAPAVTTVAASTVTSTTAVLNGSANPAGTTGTGWFRYSTTDPGTCNDTFGTRTPTIGGAALGSGTTGVAYTASLTGLFSGTTYYYCALASNAAGTGVGAVMSFSTPGLPTIVTQAATAVSSSVATLNATGLPRGSDTTGYFRYSTVNPGTCNTTFGTRAPTTGGTTILATAGVTSFSTPLTGLTPSTTYFFCALGQNAVGTSVGVVLSFTTPSGPTVLTAAASSITATGATLNGSANPLGVATTAWFRYSTVNPGTCNNTFGTREPVMDLVVGSGTTAAAFSAPVTGLMGGTTYYFCAIAQSTSGLGFGAVQSFFTPAQPSVTTNTATFVGAATATFGGSVNANGDTTTAWIRYSTTMPGACDDTFGTRLPTTGGAAIGNGTTAQPFSLSATGLTSGATYYFCAIAQNGLGTVFGNVLSVTTLAQPLVTTNAATGITASTATLNGSATPGGTATTGYFRLSTTTPGTCNDTFGTRVPGTGGVALGAGTAAVAFTGTTGLLPGTTYFYCAIASNSVGVGVGTVASFTTLAAPPSATTTAATLVTGTTATLNGTGTANGSATVGYFRYGTTNPGTCSDTFGTRAPTTAGQALGTGTTATTFSQAVMGLTPGTTYFFCAAASSVAGTAFGVVQSFRTPGLPVVTTGQPSAIASTSATFNGTASASGADATAYFRYDTTNPGTCNDTFGTRTPATGGTTVPAATANQAFTQSVTGLMGGTTYYVCAIATNVVGTSVGTVQTFFTPALPTVMTSSASAVGTSTPRLNGGARPNGAATTGWFRYDTTDPGTCNDTFGRRAPVSGGTALGSGQTDMTFSEVVGSLQPGATYFFCAIAENSVGKAFGQVLTFNSFAPPPLVTTEVVGDITTHSATFNGTVNANGTLATGWFRYSETRPAACDDLFGTRVPAMGGMELGTGTTAVPFTLSVDGLTPATKLYVCAVASNMGGAAFGDVQEFTTTAAPPVARVTAATVEADGSVTFTGSVNPNGSQTTAFFKYGTSNTGICTFGAGASAPFEGVQVNGQGDQAQTATATGLTPGTYYVCVYAQNAAGESGSQSIEFKIDAPAPPGCGCASGLDGVAGALVSALLLFARRRRR